MAFFCVYLTTDDGEFYFPKKLDKHHCLCYNLRMILKLEEIVLAETEEIPSSICEDVRDSGIRHGNWLEKWVLKIS